MNRRQSVLLYQTPFQLCFLSKVSIFNLTGGGGGIKERADGEGGWGGGGRLSEGGDQLHALVADSTIIFFFSICKTMQVK